MKKGIRGWVILVFACLVFFITAVYFIIPKAAGLSLPFRWNSIPLQQKRELVLQYFGKPADSSEAYIDQWVAQRDNGAYILKIHYDKDSLSDSYKLYYDYRLYFIHNQYLLKEK
jgi:hypothetical protein